VEYLSQDRFQHFVDLARSGKRALAAKEYRDVSGAALSECLVAYRLARQLFRCRQQLRG
jgi:hypothetical protein